MTNQLSPHQLLDEYGLNQVTYQLLALVIEAAYPFAWFQIKDLAHEYKITGNPAPSLRKLVDRGLITGPARTEAIDARRFGPTKSGLILLARIQRGLHRPEWITLARANALQTVVKNKGLLHYSPKIYGRKFSRATLDSLVQHGYLRQESELYRLNDLGREAWGEYLVTIPIGEGVGESKANLPSPTGRGAGGEGNG